MNTPSMWPRPVREVGVKTVAVTAAEVCPEPRAEFYRHMDAANVDLKAFTDRFYREICGGHLQPVLETLIYLEARNRRLVRDHDSADSWRERLRSGARRADPVGGRQSWERMFRSTSPPFIPTGRCSTIGPHPPRLWLGLVRSPWATAFAMPTPGMSMTRWAAAPIVMAAASDSSVATGTC